MTLAALLIGLRQAAGCATGGGMDAVAESTGLYSRRVAQ